MGMMSYCRALTKCKYRWPVGQLRSNFPRGINFTAPGASADVLQHVTPLAGLNGDGIPGNLGEIDTISPTGGSSTTEPGTGVQGRSLMATNTWPGGLARGLTQLLIPPTAPKAGTKISNGLPPVPEKLVAKIRRGEFVELHELLPECLAESMDSTGPIPRSRARKKLNDISVWLQCFALYVGVLASSKPALVPDLMAYMISIIRASQEFERSAWMVYDDAYRRQAAAAGDQWQWSQVNPSLYTICFTGKVKRTGRCERCLSAAHKTEECSLPNEDDPDMAKRLKTIEAAVMALTQSSSSSVPRGQSGEICRKYNRGECTFRYCKYGHRCVTCRGNHPAVECPSKAPRPDQGANVSPLSPMRRATLQRPPQKGTPY